MSRERTLGLLVALAVGAVGCATPNGPDPYRKVNQPIFDFNEEVDKHFLEPVAEGWNFTMPVLIQIMIGHQHRRSSC